MRPWLLFGGLLAGAVVVAGTLSFFLGKAEDAPEARLAKHLRTYADGVLSAEIQLKNKYKPLDEMFSQPDWFKEQAKLRDHLKLAHRWKSDANQMWEKEEKLYETFLTSAAKELGVPVQQFRSRPDIQESLNMHQDYRKLLIGEAGRYYSAVAGYVDFCLKNHSTMKFRDGLFYWPDTTLSSRHDDLAGQMEEARNQYAAKASEFHRRRLALAGQRD